MTDPTSLSPAQKALVRRNLGLAQIIAHEHANRASEIDRDEAVSVAYQGLVTAALRFEPDRAEIDPTDLENGKAFAGYARVRIKGALLDWMRQLDHVRRSYRVDYRKIRAAGYPETATLDQVARATGLGTVRIREVLLEVRQAPLSMQEERFSPTVGRASKAGDPTGGELEGFLPAPHNVEASAMVSLLTDATIVEYQNLTQLQQTIIALRYYAQMELQQIAQKLDMNLSMVRAEHTEATLVLHEAMARKARSN